MDRHGLKFRVFGHSWRTSRLFSSLFFFGIWNFLKREEPGFSHFPIKHHNAYHSSLSAIRIFKYSLILKSLFKLCLHHMFPRFYLFHMYLWITHLAIRHSPCFPAATTAFTHFLQMYSFFYNFVSTHASM